MYAIGRQVSEWTLAGLMAETKAGLNNRVAEC